MTGGESALLELSRAWNRLRNRVLGRGTSPLPGVPADVARRVGRDYTAWRKWHDARRGNLIDALTGRTLHEMKEWEGRYRKALRVVERRAEVSTAGLPESVHVPKGVSEALEDMAEGAGAVLTAAALLAVGLAAAYAFGGNDD